MNTHIIIYSGIPGIWSFYRKFIERLILKFENNVTVYFINHKNNTIDTTSLTQKYGYQITNDYEDCLYMSKKKESYTINIFYDIGNNIHDNDFNDQINYFSNITDTIIKKITSTQNNQIITIGHSIGCYIMLKCIEKHYQVINKIYLITPIIENIQEIYRHFTIRLLKIFKYVIIMFCSMMSMILKLLSWLPIKFIFDSDTIDLYYLFKPSSVKSYINMTLFGYEHLKTEYARDLFIFDKNGDKKIHIFLGKDDKWNPRNYAKILIHDGSFYKENIYILNIPHTFIVDKLSYCKIADKIFDLS